MRLNGITAIDPRGILAVWISGRILIGLLLGIIAVLEIKYAAGYVVGMGLYYGVFKPAFLIGRDLRNLLRSL